MDPFERLQRTHRRLEERLAELTRAVSEHDHQTLVDVLDYFDRAIVRHEADEEQSLFPRVSSLTTLIATIHAEHLAHAALQHKLREAAGQVDWPLLQSLSAEIAAAYAAHITLEEGELFPAANALLDDAARRAIFDEMEARRPRRQ